MTKACLKKNPQQVQNCTLMHHFSIIRVEFTFTAYLNGTELINAVQDLNYKGGNTRTGAGLKFVSDNFFNSASSRDVPKV